MQQQLQQQQLQQQELQQQQQQQQEQQLLQEQLLLQQQQRPLTGFAYSMKELADCPPPVPEALPLVPPHIVETDDPMPEQDPPTGYPTPATSGDVDARDAAYDAAARGRQHGIEQDVNGNHHSHFFGGAGPWLGGSPGAVLEHRSGLPATAHPVHRPYQQQPAWQLPQQLAWQLSQQLQQQQKHVSQQQEHMQAAKSADGGTSTSEDEWRSIRSRSCGNGSPAPSQAPPTGYPTPCASSEGGPAASAPQADSEGPLVNAHSKADQPYGGRLLGGRLQNLLEEFPQASADLSADQCRMQHRCSCYGTPAPSQDPPSECYSGVEDDGGSVACKNCSTGHDVTAPPSPVHSDPGVLEGVPARADSSGGYGCIMGRNASSSPVPSQDAPSEYPEPESPPANAEESQGECTREPLPPGVDMLETHVSTLQAGFLSTEVSHASFHQRAEVHLPENDGNMVHYQNYVQSWWDGMQEPLPVDCACDDDYDSGESSVGSPRRY